MEATYVLSMLPAVIADSPMDSPSCLSSSNLRHASPVTTSGFSSRQLATFLVSQRHWQHYILWSRILPQRYSSGRESWPVAPLTSSSPCAARMLSTPTVECDGHRQHRWQEKRRDGEHVDPRLQQGRGRRE